MKYLICLLIPIILFSCSKVEEESFNYKYFNNNSWLYANKIFIKNDSIFPAGYSKLLVNDSIPRSYPVIIHDSCIIINKTIDKKEKIIFDTVYYDLKYINNDPVLLLYFESFPILLTSVNEELQFKETNYYKQVKFIMGGYTIGQEIDRNLLKTRGIYNYENYTIEDCELKENRDITVKIIGYNTVYSIERKNIPDFRVDDIKRVISKKLKQKPEFSPMKKWTNESDYEYEFFRWSNLGVRMTLSKSNYIGSSSFVNYFDSNDWVLSYDDDVMKVTLIEKFKNSEPKSDIIK